MKFAFQIVSVLPLASLVFGQEDGFIGKPIAAACGADRCVPISPKPQGPDGRPYAWGEEQTLMEVVTGTNELLFDYDDYFDFPDYGVMCHTCYTTIPGTDIEKSSTATDANYVYYVIDDLNCKGQSLVASTDDFMTFYQPIAPTAAPTLPPTFRPTAAPTLPPTFQPTDAPVVERRLAENVNADEPPAPRRRDAESFNLALANVPLWRRMPAEFFQDSDTTATYVESQSYPDRYYFENYCISNFRDYVDPCCLESEAPSVAPSVAPTGKPKDPCFSMMSTVYVQEKGQTSMANVEVGDVVLTMNGFEKIYTIDHRNENEATDFLQIVTDSDNAIELTSKHLIYLHDKHDPVEAGTVKVGDKLLTGTSDAAEVSKVSVVTRNGLFNPITSSGTLVVDGLATSTYTAIDVTGGSSYITIGGYKILSMHDFMHLAMGPFKVLCLNVPEAISSGFCLIEGGEEHNVYNKIGLQLLSFGKNQNIHVQSAIVLSLVTLFVGVNLFFNPIVMMISLMYTVKTFQKTKNF